MRSSIRSITALLLMVGLFSLFAGCASTNQQAMQVSQYRKMLERQKAEEAQAQSATQKIPDMTAEEYERLGDRYLAQGNRDMAFIQYRNALELDPRQVRLRYKVGYLFLEKELLEEAEYEFREILKAKPKYAPAHEGLGRIHFQRNEMERARESFMQALQLDGSLWQAHNHLGIIDDREGRFDQAIDHFQSALSLRPNEPLLFNNLGMSLLRKGEDEKAVRAFEEGLKMGGASPKMYNNLALALCKLGRYAQALEALKKCGDEASAYYNLGIIYMAQKKYKEAIDSFDRAILLTPGFHAKAHEKRQQAKAALAFSPQ